MQNPGVMIFLINNNNQLLKKVRTRLSIARAINYSLRRTAGYSKVALSTANQKMERTHQSSTAPVTTQDFIKFWGKIFVFILLVLIEISQGFKTF
jgi:hypothetical protein